MDVNRGDVSDSQTDDSVPVEDLYQLTGTPLPEDQDAVVEPDEIEMEQEYTDTERYELLPEPVDDPEETIEVLVARERRAGETEDPNVAAEEGLVYVPPTDPPVVPTEGPEDLEIAAGFGMTARDEPYDDDHAARLLSAEDEMAARVRDAIRADAVTTQYADDIEIDVENGIVVLRGVVEDIDDTDALADVASAVDGVTDVRDELAVAGL
jgi:hypothetical protein